MLAVPGYDYVLTGYSWPRPDRITYSIAPDGVFWDHGTNRLNAVMNSGVGTDGQWQRQIARAVATWQAAANLDIVPVADGSYDQNTVGLSQGDARFGDIRLGGYAFVNNSTTLAQSYFPPPNGTTASGDVEINTSLSFGVGTGYDLYSVVLHETGHSLGLDHAKNPAEVMYPDYKGVRSGLSAGDVAGIQAIYGARSPDSFHQRGSEASITSPIDLSGGVTTSARSDIRGLSLTSIGDVEYFSVTVPGYASGMFTVTAGAYGVSMLSPQVSILDSRGALLSQAGNPAAWSDDVSTQLTDVVAGQTYLIAVTGATHDVFDVGAYHLTLTFQGTPPVASPVLPPISTTSSSFDLPTGNPLGPAPDRFESNNTPASATPLGRISQSVVDGLTFHTGSDIDYFSFQAARLGSFQISAWGARLQVYNRRGRLIKQATNSLNVKVAKGGGYLVRLTSLDRTPVASYMASIGLKPAALARRRLVVPSR